MTEFLLVTNNDRVCNLCEEYDFIDGDFRDVLLAVRDLVHNRGHKIITHPLPASSRMFLSPVRSVLLEKGATCSKSVEVIENSIALYDQALINRKQDYTHCEDYQILDLNLMQNALLELDHYHDEAYQKVPFGTSLLFTKRSSV